MFGLTTTRRLNAETTAIKAVADQLRKERDNALAERRAFRAAATAAAEQVIDVSIINDCLTRDLLVSRRQRVIARKAAARIAAALAEERKRADRLQQRLDQALGLDSAAVALGSTWQSRRADKGSLAKGAAS